jgi:hypothetical protein
MRLVGDGAQIMQVSEDVRHLHNDAARVRIDRRREILVARRCRRECHHAVPGHRGDGLDGGAIMRMQVAGEHRLVAARDAVRHQHGFGGRRRPVVHRGVRHLHAGEHGDLGLELEQIVQRALGDLRLVRRV